MEPGWRISASEEGRDLRKTVWAQGCRGTVSQLDVVLWDMERRSTATYPLLLGRRNVVGESRELYEMKLLSPAPGVKICYP